MLLQRGLGLARLITLTYLMSTDEMGQWGLGMVLFTLGAPLVTLGLNQSMVRYVSYYEARNELMQFYRRARRWVILIVAIMSLLLLAASTPLLELVAWLRDDILQVGSSVKPHQMNPALLAAVLANITLMGIYLSMLSFIYGLRAYRLAALIEAFFAVTFTALAVALVAMDRSAVALLASHALALCIALLAGGVGLHVSVRYFSSLPPADVQQGTPEIEPRSDGDVLPQPVASTRTAQPIGPEVTEQGEDRASKTPAEMLPPSGPEPAPAARGLRAILPLIRYGFVTMFGAMIWQAAGFVSLVLTYLRYGSAWAGPFLVFMQLSQPIAFLANAVWGVLFAHIAKRWESGDRGGAQFVLETAFRGVALVVMTLTVLLYVTAPFWSRIVSGPYQGGYAFLQGLMAFFVAISNLSLLTILAKLHKRPGIIVMAALAGAGLNIVLALLWMPAAGPVGAARAAGVGMFFGGGLVALVYLLASGTRLHDSTYFILGTPVLLLLPPYIVGPVWMLILPVCIFSKWYFNDQQREVMHVGFQRGLALARDVLPW